MTHRQDEGCLHLVMGANRDALDTCLACCGPADTLVLMNAAVTFMAGPLSIDRAGMANPILCLAADVCAHGLQEIFAARGAATIDDRELVRLVCLHRHCLSWK